MSFFRRKKSGADPVVIDVVKRERTVLFKREFAQASSFRGFRRIKLSTARVNNFDQTLAFFRDNGFDFKGCTVVLECIKEIVADQTYLTVNVYVNGHLIGFIGPAATNSILMLTEYEYDKVYVKVDEFKRPDGSIMGDNVYLFVHYPGEAPE